MTAAHTIVGSRTLPAILRTGAQRHPDRPLLVFDDGDGGGAILSWAAALRGAAGLAAHLAGEGVRAGDRVHVHLPNRPEFLLAWFALAELGAAMVPTNTASSAAELAFMLRHSGAVMSIADVAGAAVVADARRLVGVDLPTVVCEEAGVIGMEATPGGHAATPGTELAVLYTSGTTSRPKGVRVTHANYIYAGEVYAAATRMTAADRVFAVLPLFHANSQYYSTMSTLVCGATLVLGARFSASRWISQASRHRATVANLFAAPIRMILRQEPGPGWREHGLRAVMFAQNISADEWRRWHELVGAPLFQLYGMTETIGPPLMTPLDGPSRHDGVGRPALGYACRLERPDRTPPAVGEPGELLVGGIPGVSLMAGYLDDPDATAAALADGWLRTGDVFRVGEDGTFRFVDRRKDLIKRSGENVATSEVEDALCEHPAVLEAAVVGVPDAVRDEEIVAFAVTDGTVGAPDLLAWASQRLAKFRVPGAIELVDELPRTSVGKVRKHLLRASWIESNEPRHDDAAGDLAR